MKRPKLWQRSAQQRRPNSRPSRRSVQEVLSSEESPSQRHDNNIGLVEAELLAARNAELAGGGSPVWSAGQIGPGEELALAVEVARAIRNHRCPPQNPYHDATHQS